MVPSAALHPLTPMTGLERLPAIAVRRRDKAKASQSTAGCVLGPRLSRFDGSCAAGLGPPTKNAAILYLFRRPDRGMTARICGIAHSLTGRRLWPLLLRDRRGIVSTNTSSWDGLTVFLQHACRIGARGHRSKSSTGPIVAVRDRPGIRRFAIRQRRGARERARIGVG